MALLGKNGSGKTTLLRIISGIYTRTSGILEIKDIPRAFFNSWVGLNQELFVIDNIYLFGAIYGMDRKFIRDRFSQIIEFSELRHLQYTPLKNLFPGQAWRMVLSAFLQIRTKFFILDENLIFLDQNIFRKYENHSSEIYSSNAAVIMTSHDMSFLKKYCHRALWLQEGRLRMDGGIEEVIAVYEQS